MPITRILWAGTSNQDIHVLRGQSTRDLTLADLQFIDGSNRPFAHDYLAAHQGADHDVDLTFSVVPVPADDVFENQGIVVDGDTGEVNLINAVPAPPQPTIVGLYGGGAQYASGIFHPTGQCIMRNEHVETAEFCAVCRYVMVDLVNPSKHFEIDRDYDDIYPLR